MALNTNDIKFLLHSRLYGVDFAETITLGRQHLFSNPTEINRLWLNHFGQDFKFEPADLKDEFAEPVFRKLGASVCDSLDFSAYEKASIIHDLNQPIPTALKNKYSLLVDGGTMEHIFNFPVAIKNCMEMLKTGGHYIGISPANNLMGHGFYQFSPELFYRVFAANNGFKIKKMLINISAGNTVKWYEVMDPQLVNNRVMLCNSHPVFLYVLAEKTAHVPVFIKTPQQQDYQNTWDAFQSVKENKMIGKQSRLKFMYRKLVPGRLKYILRNVYDLLTVRKEENEFIGLFDPRHFKETEL